MNTDDREMGGGMTGQWEVATSASRCNSRRQSGSGRFSFSGREPSPVAGFVVSCCCHRRLVPCHFKLSSQSVNDRRSDGPHRPFQFCRSHPSIVRAHADARARPSVCVRARDVNVCCRYVYSA